MMQSKVDLDIDGILEYVKQQSVQIANPLGYLVAYLGSTKIIIPYYNA